MVPLLLVGELQPLEVDYNRPYPLKFSPLEVDYYLPNFLRHQ